MDRTQIFDMMGELKLYGMRHAYDEVMALAIKREHEPPRVIGDLLKAEIDEKTARSIKYQLTIAKLPLAKDIDGFAFEGTPINETLVRDLATGRFLAEERNAVFIGGTGTGKSHLAIALGLEAVKAGRSVHFITLADLIDALARFGDAPADLHQILVGGRAVGLGARGDVRERRAGLRLGQAHGARPAASKLVLGEHLLLQFAAMGHQQVGIAGGQHA